MRPIKFYSFANFLCLISLIVHLSYASCNQQDFLGSIDWSDKIDKANHQDTQAWKYLLDHYSKIPTHLIQKIDFKSKKFSSLDIGQSPELFFLMLNAGYEFKPLQAKEIFECQVNLKLPLANNNVGYCYNEGIGVAKDRGEAMKWYETAAMQGNPIAQFNIGVHLYNDEDEQVRDLNKGEKRIKEAAMQKYAPAQYQYGVILINYVKTRKIFKDIPTKVMQDSLEVLCASNQDDKLDVEHSNKAIKWLEKAAKQGHVKAQYNLGLVFKKGFIVQKNLHQALYWFDRSKETYKFSQSYLAKQIKFDQNYYKFAVNLSHVSNLISKQESGLINNMSLLTEQTLHDISYVVDVMKEFNKNDLESLIEKNRIQQLTFMSKDFEAIDCVMTKLIETVAVLNRITTQAGILLPYCTLSDDISREAPKRFVALFKDKYKDMISYGRQNVKDTQDVLKILDDLITLQPVVDRQLDYLFEKAITPNHVAAQAQLRQIEGLLPIQESEEPFSTRVHHVLIALKNLPDKIEASFARGLRTRMVSFKQENPFLFE